MIGAVFAISVVQADAPDISPSELQIDRNAPTFVDRLENFESPWGSLSERAQSNWAQAARRATSSFIGGFVTGVTSPALREEAAGFGAAAGRLTSIALEATGVDRTLAGGAVTTLAAAHEAIAVDTEIRYIQAEWKINAVRNATRAVRNAAVEAAETAVETVDRATRSGPGRVMRNCARAMFSTRGC